MPVLQEGRSPSPVNFLANFGGAEALRRDGTTQESGAQPVVRRHEMRAAPRDPPQPPPPVLPSGVKLGWTG